MRYKRAVSCMVMAWLSVLLASCSSPGGGAQDVQEKTGSVDINAGHIQLELMEKVSVDAEITPYSRYKDGLSAYYLESSLDNHEKTDIEAYKKNPVLFNRKAEEVAGEIEEADGGSFDWGRREINTFKNDLQLVVPYHTKVGEKKEINCWWRINSKGQFAGTEFYLEGYDAKDANDDSWWATLGSRTLTDDAMYKEKDFGFASCDEVTKKMRTLVERITGRKLAEKMHCVPMTEKMYHKVMKMQGESEEERPYPGEYYTCIMYQAVDGFPWKVLISSEPQESGMRLSERIMVSEGFIFTRNEYPQRATYNKDGIMWLELDSFFYPGKVYKEKERACTVEKVLEQTEKYFQDVLLRDPVTVYEITLAYASYFTDQEDGPLEDAVCPFWVVKYWDGEWAKQIVFDAYTGKYLSSGDGDAY